MPDLSYEPATPLPDSAFSGIVTVEFHIAPGQGGAFQEAIQAINKSLAELKYPYRRSVAPSG